MSLKEKILAANDLASIGPIEVPEWAITKEDGLFIRTLTSKELDDFEQSRLEQKGDGIKVNLTKTRARLAALVLADESGKRLFADRDIEALACKSGPALVRVYEMAAEHNRIGKDDREELRKNYLNGQPAGSPTD